MIETVGDAFSAATFLVFGAAIVPVMLDGMGWAPLLFAVLALTVVRMVPVALALLGTGARAPTVAFVGWFGPRGLASIVFAVLIFQGEPVPNLRPDPRDDQPDRHPVRLRARRERPAAHRALRRVATRTRAIAGACRGGRCVIGRIQAGAAQLVPAGPSGEGDRASGGDRRASGRDRVGAGWDGGRRPDRGEPGLRALRELCRTDGGRPDREHPADGDHDDERRRAGCGIRGRRRAVGPAAGCPLPAHADRRRPDGRRGAAPARPVHAIRLALGDDRVPDRRGGEHRGRPDPGPHRRRVRGSVRDREGVQRA